MHRLNIIHIAATLVTTFLFYTDLTLVVLALHKITVYVTIGRVTYYLVAQLLHDLIVTDMYVLDIRKVLLAELTLCAILTLLVAIRYVRVQTLHGTIMLVLSATHLGVTCYVTYLVNILLLILKLLVIVTLLVLLAVYDIESTLAGICGAYALATSLQSIISLAFPNSDLLYEILTFLELINVTSMIIVLAIPAVALIKLVLARHRAASNTYQKNEQQEHLSDKYLLVLGLVLSILFCVLPYMPQLNPNFYPVSVDTLYYYDWLVEAQEHGGIAYLFAEDVGLRPIYLTLLYVLVTLGVDTLLVAQYHNLPYFPLLALTLYLYVKASFRRHEVAIFTPLVFSCSYLYFTFLYSGFQANHFTLILYLLALYLALARAERTFYVAIASLLAGICTLTHPWTWLQLSTAVTLYYVYTRKSVQEHTARALKIFVVGQVLAGLIALVYHLNNIHSIFSPMEPQARTLESLVNTLLFKFRVLYWSTLSDALLYYLSLLGIILTLRERKVLLQDFLTLTMLPLIPAGGFDRALLNTLLLTYAVEYVNTLRLRAKFLFYIVLAGLILHAINQTVQSIPRQVIPPYVKYILERAGKLT